MTQQQLNLSDQLFGWRDGQGPNLLLIHGVGMHGDYWSNIIAELKRSFTLTVIDLPGHGKSPTFTIPQPQLSDYTHAIAAFIAAAIAEPVSVVGHSMGALIALDLAVKHPSSITGIGVMNGVYRRSVEAQAAINARVTELSATKLNSSTKSDPENTLARWFGKTPTGINLQSANACRTWLDEVNQKGYYDAYRAFANADAPTDDQLKKIACPALFMTGSQEPNSTPAMSLKMSQLAPKATCVIVDGARHMMSMTHGPQITQAVVDFFLHTNRELPNRPKRTKPTTPPEPNA